ncbi:MAG: glutamate-5-semialdehyde dehydrogenase [Ferruginibacter sp.]|nr:glutamate-5-semialdehyde dehydrogenase [Ferruginibacter sp.]
MIKQQYSLQENFEAVQKAGKILVQLSHEQVNKVLISLSEAAIINSEELLKENQKDLDRMPADDPKYDRLKLSLKRIKDIAGEMINVAALPTPLGKVLEERTMTNGLHISKITVPLGVIGIIYEARPNVTFDVFSLCLKSGNACILKGGSDAEFSNKAIVKLIRLVLKQHGLPEYCIELLPATREAATELLNAVGYVDVIIPRGSQQLINYVRKESRVPVIETGAGIVHAYFDQSGDTEKGKNIIFNSKTRRVSVCNALDCLIIHTTRLQDLPGLVINMANQNVLIYADDKAYEVLENKYPGELLTKADDTHYGIEFLDYKMAIKTVSNIEEAINHISEYSSRHSETIIAEDKRHIEQFIREVDAAVVYSNVSTAFTDGAQFGLGAEIGISTQKLHARGPMGLSELCSYKWVIRGNGQVRE